MKKILALSITVAMVFSMLATNVLASSSYEAELLSDLSVMQGDPNGNMRYSDKVSRAECAKIVVPHQNIVILLMRTINARLLKM